MKPQDLSKAKNKDIAASMDVMKRAAAMARSLSRPVNAVLNDRVVSPCAVQ